MSQEKAKTYPLHAVLNTAENAREENFDESPRVDDEAEICPLCYGSGMEVVPGKGARHCKCRKQKSKEDLLEKLRIPKRFRDCHLQNYKYSNESQRDAYKFASELAYNYPAVERGVLLMGSVGVGKTHLAVSIIKSLTEKGFSCLFSEFGLLLKEIQDSYNQVSKTSELKVLAPVFNTEILVLDEIGASKPTDWVRDTMAHIINTRYNDKKLTIFTTNYLDKRSGQEEILEERIGVRLRSRLYEMCRTVNINGEDFRKKIDKKSLQLIKKD